MRCQDIARLDSAYIDGELDADQTEAFRTHLQQCTACRQATSDLATMVDVASQLAPIEPPAHLWAAIRQELQSDAPPERDTGRKSARLNTRESRDSFATGWLDRLAAWWSPHWRFASLGALTAVAVLLVWSLGGDVQRESTNERAALGASPGASPEASGDTSGRATSVAAAEIEPDQSAGASHTDTLIGEMQAADQRYSDTIAELRAMVEEERDTWPSATSAAYEKRMRQFENTADRHRQALAPAPSALINERPAPDPRGRDALYEVYQAEIAFLQQVAIDGPPALPGSGGRP